MNWPTGREEMSRSGSRLGLALACGVTHEEILALLRLYRAVVDETLAR